MSIDSELENLERELKASMAQLDKELATALGNAIPIATTSPADPLKHPMANDAMTTDKLKTGSSPNALELLSPMEYAAFLQPSATRILSTLSAVMNSPHVLGNDEYRFKAQATQLHFEADNFRVNALALSPNRANPKLKAPLIVYFEGLANMIRLTAACIATHHRKIQKNRYSDSSWFKSAIRSIGERMEANSGVFSPVDTKNLATRVLFPNGIEDDTVVTYAQNYTEAMERFVFAHELGHICYGHTMGSRDNYEISRMQERDADSFASQCASSDTHRETSFLGQLFVTLIFAWAEERITPQLPTTHPAGRERFMNAIHLNPGPAKEACETLGLSIDDLRALLP